MKKTVFTGIATALITPLNENGIDYLKKNIQPCLENNDYYLAIDTFASLSDELLEMAEEESTEVSCHFCDKTYKFSSKEIKELAQK